MYLEPKGMRKSVAQAGSIPERIADLAAEAETRDRVLTDGRRSVTYGETAALLEVLERQLRPLGIDNGAPIALECSQSVTGALALLYVLSRRIDVVLLPDISGTAKESGTPRFVPSFCSHLLTASATREQPGEPYPACAVEASANPGFTPDGVLTGFEGPDLYLRTSGSTGNPKLARMSHQKWWLNARGCVERWGLRGEDRLSVPVPIFHSYGFGAAFLPGLLVGAAMDFGSGGNLLRYLEREERFAPDVAFLTPALCDSFVSVRKSPRPYRFSITAGDKIKAETVAAFEQRFGPLLNLYGSAEMGAVSSASPADPAAARLGTAGYALPGIELEVGEPDEPSPEVAGARSGALRCRQRYGLDGYLILEEAGWRFEPRSRDDWFETGDLARLRNDGYLELQGRARLSAKRDGLLVVFADVEAAMERVDGVSRAVVVAAGESARGCRLVAAYQPREGAALKPEEVRQASARTLPRYAVPDEVVLLEALPLLPSGKVDRRAITELLAGRDRRR